MSKLDYCFESHKSPNVHAIKKRIWYDLVNSTPHQKLCFITYLLEDEQELSLGMLKRLQRIYNFYCSMLLYYPFWMFMGFTLHFYIIFGTNLLTGGPARIAVFLPISVFRRNGISNGVQTEWNLRERDFPTEHDPGDLDPTPSSARGGHEGGGRPPGRAPLPHGPLGAPPTYSFLLYIPTYPRMIRTGAKNLIPPPQPSVSTRYHFGACSGAPPEGASTMEGFYIITIAPQMKCE